MFPPWIQGNTATFQTIKFEPFQILKNHGDI